MPEGVLTAAKKLIVSIKGNGRYLAELLELLEKMADENDELKSGIDAYIPAVTEISTKCHDAVDILSETIESIDEEAGRIIDPEDKCLRAVMNAVRTERYSGELIDKIRNAGFFAIGEEKKVFDHICERKETQLLYVNQLLVMFASLSDADM